MIYPPPELVMKPLASLDTSYAEDSLCQGRIHGNNGALPVAVVVTLRKVRFTFDVFERVEEMKEEG